MTCHDFTTKLTNAKCEQDFRDSKGPFFTERDHPFYSAVENITVVFSAPSTIH